MNEPFTCEPSSNKAQEERPLNVDCLSASNGRATLPAVETDSRRLCVFFEAVGTRYALEAVRVLEVAKPEVGEQTLHGNLGLRDLPEVLGGAPGTDLSTALVLDSSPTLAVRVGAIEGVFDSNTLLNSALSRRLIPVLSPAVRGTLLKDDRLYFELDADAVSRGLPKQLRRPEIVTSEAAGPCLVFESGDQRFGVPLPLVKQVIARGAAFNRAPGRGAFVGVVHHREAVCPVFSLTGVEPEPLIVLLDLGDGGVGVCARRADGVTRGLEGLTVLDPMRMFS